MNSNPAQEINICPHISILLLSYCNRDCAVGRYSLSGVSSILIILDLLLVGKSPVLNLRTLGTRAMVVMVVVSSAVLLGVR
jgi:hypothetical protein